MLVCVAGMSSSLLVTKMQKAANDQNLEAEIFAIPESEVDKVLSNKNVDVMLLGPQVRYLKGTYQEKYKEKNIPIEIINMTDYGMMNGSNVLKHALELIG